MEAHNLVHFLILRSKEKSCGCEIGWLNVLSYDKCLTLLAGVPRSTLSTGQHCLAEFPRYLLRYFITISAKVLS